jgi:FkbM family methyltransferase
MPHKRLGSRMNAFIKAASLGRYHKFKIRGVPISVFDSCCSRAASFVARELQNDTYGVSRIAFAPGDVVLDIGAHIGLFSIYMGLCFPDIIIHSFEPFPPNYRLLSENIKLNEVQNVHLHNLALSGNGRMLQMATNSRNSGGATAYSVTLSHLRTSGVPSITLDEVFAQCEIARCKLLKIDCEGAEYEVLLSSRSISRVEHLSGEVHVNELLSKIYRPTDLIEYCERNIDPKKVVLRICRMSE